MFDSKTDKAGRKLALSKKQEKENKKKRITTITILSAFLLISAIAITVNSNFIRRTVPVITIDGVGFSAAEFEFFFNSEYTEYMQFLSQFQGMGLPEPEPDRSLSDQINPSTGESWAAFFTDRAVSNMTETATLYNLAVADGFTLSQEQLAEIDEDLAMIEMQAMFNQFPSVDSLLQRMFGSSMNERTYRSLMEMTLTARLFSESIRNSFVFSADELAAYYNEHRDELDAINYREFLVDIEFPTIDMPDDEEEFENAMEQASLETNQRANDFAGEIHSEEDFIYVAGNYNESLFSPEATQRRVQGARLDADKRDWLIDDSRIHGDTTIVDSDWGSTVIFFVSRDGNDYRTVTMRQLLLLRETIDPDEFFEGINDPGYIIALENAENDLHERAQEVYALFNSAGRTEQALLDLIDEYSDDTTEGGYYPDITQLTYQGVDFQTMRVVPEIENWLFDSDRVIGDSELIYTADFGYHLTYFFGEGDIFFEMIARDRLRSERHGEWLNGLHRATPVRHAAFFLVHI
jgi:hypothetical protein